MSGPADLPCNQFVELVTDYLEGALATDEVARVDAHLPVCADCAEVLQQWRVVIALSHRLGEEDVRALGAGTRAALITAFRQARAEREAP